MELQPVYSESSFYALVDSPGKNESWQSTFLFFTDGDIEGQRQLAIKSARCPNCIW